jgi:hypothetical protein
MPLSLAQQTIIDAPQRFKVVIAGRRFGKTHLSIRELCRHARLPDQTVWYVAPTYRQAKMITWKKLRKKLVELRWAKKINETELSIELKNGSTIALKGADNYDSLRGIGLDFLVIDEFADVDAEAWNETLRPTLADRQGGALFIGTPKGMNWAHDLFNLGQEYPDEWVSFQFTTIQGGNVKPEEIEAARRSLDIRTFRQEFEATFETFSGRIFYAFERARNVRAYPDRAQANFAELHIGMDFNVDPMSAVVAVRTPAGIHVIDEIKIFGSNTDELVDEIKVRYPKSRIICYPDPAGAARKTSAGGRSDHTILRAAGFQVKAPSSHNSVRDGINAVNAKLCSSTGITTLYIDPVCKYAIECLEKQTYKEGTSQPDKSSGFDHMNDALRYMIDYLFPVRPQVTPPPTQLWTHKIG